MPHLNFHHLHYFWAVAKDGSLTKAARRLHVSQSAISTQIRQLEEQLGHSLFVRSARSMQLTETGRVALGYADSIFSAGDELMAVVTQKRQASRQILRVGSVATLSRNFQENFFRPLLSREDIELSLQSGSMRDLLARLRVHTLDIILSNQRVTPTTDDPWQCQRIARQQVSLVGKPLPRGKRFRFPEDLSSTKLLLPGRDSDVRSGFDLSCAQMGVRYRLMAEVDDMALLRLLTRDTNAVALIPRVVVQDELAAGALVEHCQVPDLFESFYAITVRRRFAPPLLKTLLAQPEATVLKPPKR